VCIFIYILHQSEKPTKSIDILSYLVETDIGGKGKDTLLVETSIGKKGKVYFWWKRVTPICHYLYNLYDMNIDISGIFD
jgi:hypothetical protein